MKIRVLVVDDSAFMRKIVGDILKEDPDIEIVGTAKNGKEALEKMKELKPTVVTMDVEMPVMDGLTTLEKIMEDYKNMPVLMISSLTSEGAEATLRALELGAVDFVTKPKSIFKMDAEDKKKEIIEKLKMASKAKISKVRTRKRKVERVKHKPTSSSKNEKFKTLVAIGTSTGGPRALQAIIPNIPSDVNASFTVVQHMPPGFTKSLADRLNSMSEIVVKEAEDGEIMMKGHCYVAPGDYHLKVTEISGGKYKIKLDNGDLVSGHRPSVDVMFDSVSDVKNVDVMGVILTGMGADGAKGMKKLKEQRGYTVAQDEDTCVVYGMPKSAVNNGSVEKILPLEKIAREIIAKVGV